MTLEDGRVLQSSDAMEKPVPGRKVCIFGDCSSVVGEGPLRVCQGADILVHEATLADEQQEKAVDHGHSTPKMAAAVAQACGARRLVLYHFSQRYKPSALQKDGDGRRRADAPETGGGRPAGRRRGRHSGGGLPHAGDTAQTVESF